MSSLNNKSCSDAPPKPQAPLAPTSRLFHGSETSIKLRSPIKPSRNKENLSNTTRKVHSFVEYHGK